MNASIESRAARVVIETLDPDPSVPVKLTTHLVDDLRADWTDYKRLAFGIEREFGGTLTQQQLENIARVRDVVSYAKRRNLL